MCNYIHVLAKRRENCNRTGKNHKRFIMKALLVKKPTLSLHSVHACGIAHRTWRTSETKYAGKPTHILSFHLNKNTSCHRWLSSQNSTNSTLFEFGQFLICSKKYSTAHFKYYSKNISNEEMEFYRWGFHPSMECKFHHFSPVTLGKCLLTNRLLSTPFKIKRIANSPNTPLRGLCEML